MKSCPDRGCGAIQNKLLLTEGYSCEDYWIDIRIVANALKSDGCSHVVDIYKDCCLEHDVHYRTGKRLDDVPITRAQADAQLRRCIQSRSIFGKASPISWTRWLGVRLGGWWAWKKARKG